MVTYRVMSWRDIPTQVKVTDDSGATVSKAMPVFFQQEVDRVAMAEGLIDSDEYLEAWGWSDEAERDGSAEDGSAEEVAEAVVTELEEAWRREHA